MPALPTVLDVSCPWCDSPPGERCTQRPSGTFAAQPHRRRWAMRSAQLRNDREFIVRILEPDARLGLIAGEHYAAISYWLDPGSKITLLRRISDGWAPECNQYFNTVEFVRWASQP